MCKLIREDLSIEPDPGPQPCRLPRPVHAAVRQGGGRRVAARIGDRILNAAAAARQVVRHGRAQVAVADQPGFDDPAADQVVRIERIQVELSRRDRRPLREVRVADLMEVVGKVGRDPQSGTPAGRFPEPVAHGQQAARIVGEAVVPRVPGTGPGPDNARKRPRSGDASLLRQTQEVSLVPARHRRAHQRLDGDSLKLRKPPRQGG